MTEAQRKLIVVMHILLSLICFQVSLDAYILSYICNLLLSLMCKLVFVEALVYAILKAHAIFLSVILLLTCVSLDQAKVPPINVSNVQVALRTAKQITQ